MDRFQNKLESLSEEEVCRWTEEFIDHLFSQGVTQWCVCAGARNVYLVRALKKIGGEIFSFFDERSASFFALGLSKAQRGIVGVLTTSGTAVSETLSALIEGHYSGAALCVVSGDRPKFYRGSGAPQSIDQAELLKPYCRRGAWDITAGDDFKEIALGETSRGYGGNIHVNVCYDEPGSYFVVRSDSKLKTKLKDSSEKNPMTKLTLKYLAIVSGLETEAERVCALHFLKKMKIPVYLEGTSGLRGHPDLSDCEITTPDFIWRKKITNETIVFRWGGVPTTRVWRDLEHLACEVVNVSRLPFSGLGRLSLEAKRERSVVGVGASEKDFFRESKVDALEFQNISFETLNFDKLNLNHDSNHLSFESLDSSKINLEATLEEIKAHWPDSELAVLNELSLLMKSEDFIYIGNSLPIREWDWVAHRHEVLWTFANRGANGIDGQISTAMGMIHAKKKKRNWILLGDLTALYDLNALNLISKREAASSGAIRIIILNNSGGRIFNRMFNEPLLENNHEFQFSGAAEMFGCSYKKIIGIDGVQQLESSWEGVELIELLVSWEQNKAAMEYLEALSKMAVWRHPL